MFDREKLMSHVEDEEEELTIASTLDKVELALKRHEPTFTNFLNPYQRSLLNPILDQIYDLKYREYGKFKQAERKRIGLMPDYYMLELVEEPLAVLEIKGNFKFESVSHRDFLGAILGTGIKREMVGDLVIGSNKCQAIVAEEIKEYLTLQLDKVHRVPVDIEEISQERLEVAPERIKKIKSTVASLRLDSVASSGFTTSRSKMAKEIKAGNVKLNWKVENDSAKIVDIDDIISIRGRGRVEIDKRLGKSRKGRIKLVLKRYI
ncbi:YlmH family RNA-binding protein [Selenihalanaerobacter shriftii]|uniref:RNA-binding protein YlmH, contains S4-like domain n=1 Tax=Selenihalanaerobacter shriftii TaxID=142842 RepID=A0A1T4JKD9_9FIRM|nr:YlmH/Sll1252 family protein [Selenihalanaerobacter shriftii]SJZ30635.1 RNA-binding protein YlmH, contains S4-like domain [Selenihalanaerobacter shriftii]